MLKDVKWQDPFEADEVLQVLIESRQRISNIDNWTSNRSARDANGREVTPIDPSAVSWCSVGAIAVSLQNLKERLGVVPLEFSMISYLDKYVQEENIICHLVGKPITGIAVYNDMCAKDAGTRHQKVLNIFDRAIEGRRQEIQRSLYVSREPVG